MKQNIIDEYVEIIELTYKNYLNEPTWPKIQMLFQRFFYLGVEIGKEMAIRNFNLSKQDYFPSENQKQESRNTPEALMMLLEIYKAGEIEFNDDNVADKAVDNLRAFCKYNKLEYKFSKKGKSVKLVC